MGISRFNFITLWYLVPFLYLALIEGVFPKNSALILLVFLIGLSAGFYSFKSAVVDQPFSYEKLLTRFFKLVLLMTAVIEAYGFYRVINDGFDLARYRMDFFEDAGGVFKNTYLYTLYTVFLKPLLLVGTMYFLCADSGAGKKNKFIYFCFLVILLDGLLSLGRFPYLFVLFFVFLAYKKLQLKRLTLILLAAVGVIISFVVIYFRQFYVDTAVETGLDIVNQDVFRSSVISYQYNGYLFLDKLVAEKGIFGQAWEMNTPSFLFLFLKTLTSKFGLDFGYNWEEYNLVLTEGMYYEKLDLHFNAFSTNFLPVYLDFGIPGIFLFGVFSGAFIGFRSNNPLIKAMQYLNLFILVFGLYQPIITTLQGFILLMAFGFAIIYLIREYVRKRQLERKQLI